MSSIQNPPCMVLRGLPLLSRDDLSLLGGCSDQLALKVGQNALKTRVPWRGEDGLVCGAALAWLCGPVLPALLRSGSCALLSWSSQVSPKSQILPKMKGSKQELMVALKQGAKHSNTVDLALLAGEKADLRLSQER